MVEKQAYSVQQFCEAHSLSRATFYRLIQLGTAPAVMKCGKRTLISKEAAEEWRRGMERAHQQKVSA